MCVGARVGERAGLPVQTAWLAVQAVLYSFVDVAVGSNSDAAGEGVVPGWLFSEGHVVLMHGCCPVLEVLRGRVHIQPG
jgi:hypothetical protein